MIASRKALIVVAAFVLMAIGLPWGGNVPAALAQIQVLSANPNTGDQGTVGLNVTIGGKGFKKGAKANFYLKGTTNPAGITVRATKFVSDASLVATIDIAAGATADDFDIVVANADGRTGKGTELFKVAVKFDPCAVPDPVPTLSPYTTGVPGQPGWFDSTFGNGTGKVIGPRGTQMSGTSADRLAVDDADRIIVVGRRSFPCSTNSGSELIAVRYLPDGSIDPSFGTNGVAAVSFGGGSGLGTSVVVQADGKIVIGGVGKQSARTGSLPVIVRLDEHGTLDPTFGSGGVFWMTLFGTKPNGAVMSVALQANGTEEKVVATGWSNAGPWFLCRLKANGAFDVSFNGTGYSLWSNTRLDAVRVQSVGADQRILVAGSSRDSLGKLTATLWRFTNSGGLDTSFGTGTGTVQTPFEDAATRAGEFYFVMAIDIAGRILAAGESDYYVVPGDSSTIQYRTVLARYDANGVPDPSFGVDGSGRVWAPSLLGEEVPGAIAVQGDGRILVAGLTTSPQVYRPQAALWGLTSDGTSDPTFGTGGWIIDPIVASRSAYWKGMALQSDGRVVCSGDFTVDLPDGTAFSYIALARFWQ